MKKTLMTGALAAAFSVGMVLPAAAAELSNGASQSCDGLALWHFINNQTGGAAAGTLSATFTVDGNTTKLGVPRKRRSTDSCNARRAVTARMCGPARSATERPSRSKPAETAG